MTAKTRKNKQRHNKKISKRVLEMWKYPTTVWSKNKSLEKFWQGLASGKYVVVIYKNGKHKHVKLPTCNTAKSTAIFNEFDTNDNIVAVLSSNMSQDAYEIYLYPKAKDKSVDYVIKNYKNFFDFMGDPDEARTEGKLPMNKFMVPN